MKNLIILLTFILSLNGYSQNYQQKYKADLCECIQTKKATLHTIDNIYKACFVKQMTTYAVFIDAEIKDENKTQKYIKGQRARQDLQQKFIYELVYSCNAYLNLIEEKRQTVINNIRAKSIDSTKIDRLNETVAMRPNWTNYYNRGQFYYYIGDLKKAEKDVLQSIKDSPLNEGPLANAKEKILLATIYEEQKRYSEAIAIYDSINSKTTIPKIARIRAVVSRKSNGYVLKPKEVVEKSVPNSVPKPKPVNRSIKNTKNTSSRNSTRARVPQTNQTKARSPKKHSAKKSKDSIKTLRGLFKLD